MNIPEAEQMLKVFINKGVSDLFLYETLKQKRKARVQQGSATLQLPVC